MNRPFNPMPAADYPTLHQQFNALLRLHNANVNHLELMRGEVAGLISQIGMLSPGEVDSQRDANAELTALLEKQEIRLAEQAKEMTRLRSLSSSQAIEILALREEVLIKPGTAQTQYRAAADIYYQLAQECEIPEGGSLVQYVEGLRQAAKTTAEAWLKGGSLIMDSHCTALLAALDASNQIRDEDDQLANVRLTRAQATRVIKQVNERKKANGQ